MPTSYTSSLGLALPATGELTGTWGDTVNDYITKYVDASVAGTQAISGSQTAVTLSTTTGGTLAQAGAGATGSAQYQIINCTGNPAGMLTITAPATSKTYIVLNATSTNQQVKLVGTGPTTGVTLEAGERAVVAWNGSDFAKVASSATDGVSTISFGTTGLTPSTATSGAVTVAGTLAVGSGGTGATTFTANNVLLGNGTSAFQVVAPGANGNVLTSNGTTWVSQAAAASLSGTTQSVSPFATTLGVSAGAAIEAGADGPTFIGYQAGQAVSTGTRCTAVGYQALKTLSTNSFSTAVGYQALTLATAGNNTALGYLALNALTTGTRNTALGFGTGSVCVSGSQNVFIGHNAGTQGTGTNNICIGDGSSVSSAGVNNETTIGTSATTAFRLFGDLRLQRDYTEKVVTANTGTAYTIDITNGTVQNLTLTGNCVFTFPPAVAGKSFMLLLRQDATGNRTVTWPTVTNPVRWPGGTAPTVTSTGSRLDKFVFTSDGASWFGSNGGQNYSLG